MNRSITLTCCYLQSNINFIIRQPLGVCYLNGTGVLKDEVKAVKYFKMAADQGHANAQKNLGETWKLLCH